MKLTKKLETEVWYVYDTWLDSYLNGDVATYDFYLDEEYHFIGSTNNEEFLNRKDTTSFFEATADQLAGKTELRNNQKTIEQVGDLIFITHLFDAWFFNEQDWVYYARFRFTNALRKTKEGWRFIYQHFSTPDSKAQEGETIGYDQISAENLKLREAIQRHTVELKEKNRELEVESALERIRGQVVSMKQSADLLDIVVVMRSEFIKLGHEAHYFWHMRWLPDKYEKAMTSGDGTRIGMVMELPRHIHGDIPLLAQWENSKEPTVVYAMDAEAAVDYVDKMITLGDFQQVDSQAPSLDDIRHIGGLTFIMARTTHGEIGYSLPGVVPEPPEDDINILIRFAGAFDLAHKRFEDLKRSEQQTRETEIELALEKVRSRSLAMHQSEELADLSLELVKQVQNLGVATWFCAFNIYDNSEEGSLEWGSNGEGVFPRYRTPREGIFLRYYEAGQRGEDLLINAIGENECLVHYDYLCSLPGVGDQLLKMKGAGIPFPTSQIDHVAYFKYGYIIFITYEPVPEAHDVFKRFAKVFEQTYTRFLDLQKAEAQARDAQIETALERVRSRSLAMHNSEELEEVAVELFNQLKILVGDHWGSGIALCQANSEADKFWFVNENGLMPTVNIPHTKDPFHKRMHTGWKEQKPYLIQSAEGSALEAHYQYMLSVPDVAPFFQSILDEGLSFPKWQQWNMAGFSEGYLLLITQEPFKNIEILIRFAKVFGQAYTRFLDLQKAEAQAREAQIEAALERVRSQSMSMHRSDDLLGVIAVFSKEIESLGIRFNNISFGKMDASFNLKFWIAGRLNLDAPMKVYAPYYRGRMFDSLREAQENHQTVFVDTFNASQLKKFNKNIFDNNPTSHISQENITYLRTRKMVQRDTILLKDIFVFITNYKKVSYSKEEKDILLRFAKSFEQTYTRFLDLQKVEEQALQAEQDLIEIKAARKKAEDTLTELQETQKQLIQSEKMASLGELTAGIAHEIQNPLNFVNNFSDVSSEMIDEMNEELDKNDVEEAKMIAADIKQNLEKINHHGKRADSIVKGMLEHSRSSTGQKEPTDINALCDEYLRLAYHGLRAKDKTFNATLETNFDESLEKISVIPQDIGRVVLNLITNAFYAVNEKQKPDASGYEPRVEVSTKKLDGRIEISVKDNGNGIPEHVKEKIFQPFFTTKPTGQGTGLGLSLSYDIVKAHGGELKVETKEGEGTEFIIHLSIV